jgi:broad specificity phosphatase PhoE
MTHILLVRHGQTAWNRVERFRGHSDVPLNSTGLSQAHAAARRIVSSWHVDAVYTSPLKRAMETAQAVAQRCGLTPQPCDGIIDINYGEWQGLTGEEVGQTYPELYALWLTAPHRVHIPAGETIARVRRRATQAVRDLVAQHPDGTIVLISHQVVCKILVLAMMGLSTARFWHIQQETAAINVFEYVNGGYITHTVNDTCHLREGSL